VKIDFAKLQDQYQLYKHEIDEAIQSVLDKSNYIMGEEVSQLEASLQEFTGVNYAVCCGSGSDALLIALMALGIKAGDEVITTPFTFIATAEVIALIGAKPVFVDIDEDTFNLDPSKLEAAITKKTKAIIPVSLYGQPAEIDSIQGIADRHGLRVIIDGAQSFGARYKDRCDSCLGDIATTSFFPAKPLGCFGDGGAVFTDNEELAEKLRSLRVHGQSKRYHHKLIGFGARLDTIQAAVLKVKLSHYAKDIALRQKVARTYSVALQDKDIMLPRTATNMTSVWAQYSIRSKNRDTLQARLKDKGIPTAIHYPIPLHLQECFSYLGYAKGSFPIAELVSQETLSLPMNPYLSEDEIGYISENI